MGKPTRKNISNLSHGLPAVRTTSSSFRAVDATSRVVNSRVTRTAGYKSFKNASIRRVTSRVRGNRVVWTAHGVQGTAWRGSPMFLDNSKTINARNYVVAASGAAAVVGLAVFVHSGAANRLTNKAALRVVRHRRKVMKRRQERRQNSKTAPKGRRRITLRDSNGRFAGSR